MPKLIRLHWLEDLLRTEKFGYPGVRFLGIFLADQIQESDAFGVFAMYRDHDRVNERYPYQDAIYLADEETKGNPLHEICTAAHEVGHWKLKKDGDEYGYSENWAEKYAELFLHEFFTPELAIDICKVHKFGVDPCRLSGVKERSEILAKGNQREQVVGKRILKYLGRTAGVAERIESLQKRLGRMGK